MSHSVVLMFDSGIVPTQWYFLFFILFLLRIKRSVFDTLISTRHLVQCGYDILTSKWDVWLSVRHVQLFFYDRTQRSSFTSQRNKSQMEDYLCTFYGCITWWVSRFSSFVCNSSRQNYLNFHHNEPVHRIKIPKFALFYFSSNFCICFYFFKMPIYMSFLYVNETIFFMEKWLSGTEIFHIFRSCSIQ